MAVEEMTAAVSRSYSSSDDEDYDKSDASSECSRAYDGIRTCPETLSAASPSAERSDGSHVDLADAGLAQYLVEMVIDAVISSLHPEEEPERVYDVSPCATEQEFTQFDEAAHRSVETDERERLDMPQQLCDWESDANVLFERWAIILDDIYEQNYTISHPCGPLYDDTPVVSDARIFDCIQNPHCLLSLIQFVALMQEPYASQESDAAMRRSRVALDIIMWEDSSCSTLGNPVFVLKEIIFICFSGLETKINKPPSSFHVTALISYIFQNYADEVYSFLAEHESAMFILAYYIDLPGVVDLCLRLLLNVTDLRPVRNVGVLQDTHFLHYVAAIGWIPYFVSVLDGVATQGIVHSKQQACIQFLRRLFELAEIYFKSPQKEHQTFTNLITLLHYVVVDNRILAEMIQFGTAEKNIDMLSAVLTASRVPPLVSMCADEIGSFIECFLIPDRNVASPNRSSSEAPDLDPKLGAFEVVQLELIRFYLEQTRIVEAVPPSLWRQFHRWYCGKNRHCMSHTVLLGIWKCFVQYAHEEALCEFLPVLLEECVEIVCSENKRGWCDVWRRRSSFAKYIEHSTFITGAKTCETNVGSSTLLLFILFAYNISGQRCERAFWQVSKRLHTLICSKKFIACCDRAREIQTYTDQAINAAKQLLLTKRKSVEPKAKEETASPEPTESASFSSHQHCSVEKITTFEQNTCVFTFCRPADAGYDGVLTRREASSSRAQYQDIEPWDKTCCSDEALSPTSTSTSSHSPCDDLDVEVNDADISVHSITYEPSPRKEAITIIRKTLEHRGYDNPISPPREYLWEQRDPIPSTVRA